MGTIEIVGYIASGAVFITFWMRTIIPLRIFGIASNALFFFYGIYGDLTPIMLLHGCLFPLNIIRLYQAFQLKQRINKMAYSSNFDVSLLIPFMKKHKQPKGTVLFEKGDIANSIYYLEEGSVNIVEIDIIVNSKSLLGEIAIFTPDRARTQSVRCHTDCIFYKISMEKVLQVFNENPEFGLFLIKMIVNRLLSNASK